MNLVQLYAQVLPIWVNFHLVFEQVQVLYEFPLDRRSRPVEQRTEQPHAWTVVVLQCNVMYGQRAPVRTILNSAMLYTMVIAKSIQENF